MEEKQTNIYFTKSGGTASKNALTSRMNLPSLWVKAMGLSPEDKKVILTFDGNRIIIRKDK